jgi:hypothetical protein
LDVEKISNKVLTANQHHMESSINLPTEATRCIPADCSSYITIVCHFLFIITIIIQLYVHNIPTLYEILAHHIKLNDRHQDDEILLM